jgi:hypothetical protein
VPQEGAALLPEAACWNKGLCALDVGNLWCCMLARRPCGIGGIWPEGAAFSSGEPVEADPAAPAAVGMPAVRVADRERALWRSLRWAVAVAFGGGPRGNPGRLLAPGNLDALGKTCESKGLPVLPVAEPLALDPDVDAAELPGHEATPTRQGVLVEATCQPVGRLCFLVGAHLLEAQLGPLWRHRQSGTRTDHS